MDLQSKENTQSPFLYVLYPLHYRTVILFDNTVLFSEHITSRSLVQFIPFLIYNCFL